jgi:hypothetical protein
VLFFYDFHCVILFYVHVFVLFCNIAVIAMFIVSEPLTYLSFDSRSQFFLLILGCLS